MHAQMDGSAAVFIDLIQRTLHFSGQPVIRRRILACTGIDTHRIVKVNPSFRLTGPGLDPREFLIRTVKKRTFKHAAQRDIMVRIV